MSKARISEIFHSIQGEGKYTGFEQVFVRFLGCNIRCVWCDTLQSVDNHQEFDPEELMGEVQGLWSNCHSVSLTGGEPLIQKDFLKSFLPLLKKKGIKSYLETNGTMDNSLAELIEDVDIVSMDLKLPSSTKCRSYWEEHAAFLRIARNKEVFIKAVISTETQKEDITRSVQLVAAIDPEVLFILQPNYFDRENGIMDKCFDYQDYCRQYLTDVKVMPQMHKVWGVR